MPDFFFYIYKGGFFYSMFFIYQLFIFTGTFRLEKLDNGVTAFYQVTYNDSSKF